uniref:Uncharacterized protein n=1 Tax=Arundo donax TaxID=35708 RepID=A0A0A9CU99_ARUDO
MGSSFTYSVSAPLFLNDNAHSAYKHLPGRVTCDILSRCLSFIIMVLLLLEYMYRLFPLSLNIQSHQCAVALPILENFIYWNFHLPFTLYIFQNLCSDQIMAFDAGWLG